MITPKGLRGKRARPFHFRAQAPILLLGAASLAATQWFLLRPQRRPTEGYLVYSVWGAVSMLFLFLLALALDMLRMCRDEGMSIRQTLASRWRVGVSGVVFLLWTGYTAAAAAPFILESVTSTRP